jgi:hypothetical protein
MPDERILLPRLLRRLRRPALARRSRFAEGYGSVGLSALRCQRPPLTELYATLTREQKEIGDCPAPHRH